MVIKDLEEENEKLSTRCADLLNDLEKLRKEEAHWRKEKYSVDAKIKVWGENGIYAVILDLTSYRKFIMLFSLNNKLYIQIHQWGLALIYIPSLKTHSFLKIDVAKQETDFK